MDSKEKQISIAKSMNEVSNDIPVANLMNEVSNDIPVANLMNEVSNDIPVANLMNEVSNDIPVANLMNEVSNDIPVANLMNEVSNDIPVANLINGASMNLPEAAFYIPKATCHNMAEKHDCKTTKVVLTTNVLTDISLSQLSNMPLSAAVSFTGTFCGQTNNIYTVSNNLLKEISSGQANVRPIVNDSLNEVPSTNDVHHSELCILRNETENNNQCNSLSCELLHSETISISSVSGNKNLSSFNILMLDTSSLLQNNTAAIDMPTIMY